MKAAFLDFATVGAADLDPAPLIEALPGLEIYETTTPAQVIERIADVEVVLANKVRLSREVLAGAKKLKFIGLTATGVDNVDLEAAEERGIAVCNITAYCTQSVTEHVFGTLLTLTHNLRQFNEAVRDGAWQASEEFCMLDYPLRELSALTIGIAGYGDLGRSVERTAMHFGMKVLIARRRGAQPVENDGRVDFETMLQQADVVTLHCPLNESTRGLIGERELKLMRSDAILVNTARGGLVDSAALVAALEGGQIGAAAIDVLSQEPPVDGDPLLDCRHPRLFVTPHIAWGTREARQNALQEVANNINAFKRGERRNRVDTTS